MAEDTSDMEKGLLNEVEQDQIDEDLSTNERFVELLFKMNDNICALGVSLNKRIHESIVSDQPSTNKTVSAKKLTLSHSLSLSQTTNLTVKRCWETRSRDITMIPCLTKSQSLDETERTGDPFSDKLALITNKRRNHKLSDDHLKEKAEKYAQRVNPEIWVNFQGLFVARITSSFVYKPSLAQSLTL
jgi:hypothetical protein